MGQKIRNFLRLWGPVIIWYELIFFLSNQSNLKSDMSNDFLLRKAAHMVEFIILSLLIFNAILNSKLPETRSRSYINHAMAISFILSLSLAASDELHQALIKGRQGSYYDVMIDAIGMIITIFFLKIRTWKNLISPF